jgi:hypothetical protein
MAKRLNPHIRHMLDAERTTLKIHIDYYANPPTYSSTKLRLASENLVAVERALRRSHVNPEALKRLLLQRDALVKEMEQYQRVALAIEKGNQKEFIKKVYDTWRKKRSSYSSPRDFVRFLVKRTQVLEDIIDAINTSSRTRRLSRPPFRHWKK